jgi:hypothetical protein
LNPWFRGLFLCLLLSVPSFTHAQSDPVEAAFAAVPFQQWAAEGPKAELRWHPRISSPKLTLHQRIAVEVEVELDGRELVKRCCEGRAMALVEIEDDRGRVYRNYAGKDLKDAQPGLGQYMVGMSWQIFLLPGNYKATIAFFYSGRSGHSLTTQKIRVEPLKHDPLPGSWRDLPAVEFCDAEPEGLDAFLLPDVDGRLHLPVKTGRRIHVEILENLTLYPSERHEPRLYNDRLSVFLPILKTFAQLQIENGTLGVSLLDFARKRVIFDQQDVKDGQVAWPKLKDAMAANSLATIGVHDLQREDELGDFFRSEMARRLDETAGDEAMRVFILVSSPIDLGMRAPIEVSPEARGHFAVFYLRCDFPHRPAMVRESGLYGAPVEPSERERERLNDGIGKALREVKPRVLAFDSEQGLREALAAILGDLSRM